MKAAVSIYALCTLFCLCTQAIYAQPKAAFTANPITGCTPLVVQFTDASTGANTWKWDFGNGGSSTLQNPSTTYVQPGSYTVKLVVTNAQGSDSVVRTDYIQVYAQPDIAFTATPQQGCAPLQVQFSNNSNPVSGSIASVVWDFGDGQISADPAPVHTYTDASSYNVSLTVTNSHGCKQALQQTGFINLTTRVKSGFSYTYSNACQPPTAISFTNTTSTPAAASYQWSFGDGSSSTDSVVSHTYTAAGNYTVQLVAVAANGCSDTTTQTIAIGSTRAGFNMPANACTNKAVSFVNSSTPAPLSVRWDFGDGQTATTLNATHVYTAAGSYNVKLYADFGACKDSLTQTLAVSNKPATSFTVSPPSSACSVPASVQFNNTSTGAASYQWLFGDGSSSTDVNPLHSYTLAGYYTVTLISFNANGCSDTLVLPKAVHIGPPRISGISGLPLSHCTPLTQQMTVLHDSSQAITSYLWNFGDGSTSTEAEPTHTYTQAGVYDVSVILQTSSGCSDTFVLQKAVTLLPVPVADFSASPLAVCGKKPISFTNASTGAVSWIWYFGDNSSSTEQNPTHIYADTGHYTVTLVASNGQCADTVIKEKYIQVDVPIARFTTGFDCAQPYVRQFTDQSVGAQSWSWDFGDGTTGSDPNPSHTYTATGSYRVLLIVTNNSCVDSFATVVRVVDEHPAFSYSPSASTICRNQWMSFTATSYNPASIAAFNWNFGDGSTTGFTGNATVQHRYTKTGNYTVGLQVRDVNNCIIAVNQTVPLQVFGPTTAFSNDAGNCLQKGGVINFTDQSTTDGTHAITQWTWDFGDGQTASFTRGPAFQHAYQQAGNFTVKLVTTDSYGCSDTLTRPQSVIITNPQAAFALSDSIRCPNNNVTFTNKSQGLSLTYKWYFGDGQQSATTSPVHSYANPGQYDVALKITDRFGCTDSIMKTQLLTIAYVKASFNEPDTFASCPPLVVHPQNTSQNASSLQWNFGDGTSSTLTAPEHVYTMGGVYRLLLTAKGYGTCMDTVSKTIRVKGPSGSFVYTPAAGCRPANVAFKATAKNTASFVWDFSDGVTTPTTDSLISHTYLQSGNYVPRLVLIDSADCRVGINGSVPIIISDIRAGFAANPLTGCDSSLVSFADTSHVFYDNISSYQWNFGDNSPAAGAATTSHYYAQTGSYTVKLRVTSVKGCADSLTRVVNVTVHPSPDVSIQAPDSACIYSPVQWSATNSRPNNVVNKWQWQYGNGATGSGQQNSYAYQAAGQYTAQLVATNTFGCTDTATHALRVLPLPSLDAGRDTAICLGQPLQLQATGADSYTWSSNAALSCLNCSNPVATLLLPTRFYVTGRSSFGCVAHDSLFADVKLPIHVHASGNDSICIGASVQLKSSSAEQYQWYPATGLNNPNIPNPVATPQQTTVYHVIGTDNKHCFADTQQVVIAVYPIPVFNIIDSNVVINVSASDTLHTYSSPDITRWQWSPPQWLSCASCPEPVATPLNTITYTARAYNPGCSVSDKVTIQVLCNGANVYIPNTFSPNHDGMNDQFYPRGRGLTNIKSMRIFNRWGQMIFAHVNFPANSANDGWNGTFGGQDAPPDVYVYIIEVTCENNTTMTIKGNISLLR